MNTEKTERDILAHHFADEWLLVTDNVRTTSERLYKRAQSVINSGDVTPTVTLSDQLRDEWEELIAQATDAVIKQMGATAGLYVAQMLQGWGTYPFDIIARIAIQRVKEESAVMAGGNA